MNLVAALLRSGVYEVLRLVITVIFAIISLLTFPFEPISRYRIITVWSHLVLALAGIICGIRYRVIGRDNLPAVACIVLSKHQSAWETLAYQVILPPQVWVLKRELLRVPGIGLKGAEAILRERRQGGISDLGALRRLGILAERAAPFLLLNGRQAPIQLALFK